MTTITNFNGDYSNYIFKATKWWRINDMRIQITRYKGEETLNAVITCTSGWSGDTFKIMTSKGYYYKDNILRNAPLPGWMKKALEEGKAVRVDRIEYDPDTRWVKVIGKVLPIETVVEDTETTTTVDNLVSDNAGHKLHSTHKKVITRKYVKIEDFIYRGDALEETSEIDPNPIKVYPWKTSYERISAVAKFLNSRVDRENENYKVIDNDEDTYKFLDVDDDMKQIKFKKYHLLRWHFRIPLYNAIYVESCIYKLGKSLANYKEKSEELTNVREVVFPIISAIQTSSTTKSYRGSGYESNDGMRMCYDYDHYEITNWRIVYRDLEDGLEKTINVQISKYLGTD